VDLSIFVHARFSTKFFVRLNFAMIFPSLIFHMQLKVPVNKNILLMSRSKFLYVTQMYLSRKGLQFQ